MADVAQTKAPAKLAKKKVTKPKVAAAHPKYADMVAAAITSLKERGGSSRQAILKYVLAHYKVGTNQVAVNARVKIALKSGVIKGALKQAKGKGASGSFRVGEKQAAKKPKVAKAKTPKKAKTAKPKVKKAAKPKAAPAKKTAKPKKAKSPKKAKKPAAKPKTTKPKKVKTPKKKAAAKKPAKK